MGRGRYYAVGGLSLIPQVKVVEFVYEGKYVDVALEDSWDGRKLAKVRLNRIVIAYNYVAAAACELRRALRELEEAVKVLEELAGRKT